MSPVTRVKGVARARQWDVIKAAQIATGMVAVLERNKGPVACKVARDGLDVIAYHGSAASQMLHPRIKTKFKHFIDFA